MAGPLERNRSVCLPEPRPPDPFFPLAGPILAAQKTQQELNLGTKYEQCCYSSLKQTPPRIHSVPLDVW